MKKIIFVIIASVILLVLSSFCSAIGVSPGKIVFENMTRAGYAEQEVLISAFQNQNTYLFYKAVNHNWISMSFESSVVSLNNPVKAKVIVNLPEDISNGIYNEKIILQGSPAPFFGEGKSSSIVMAVTIDVVIEVMGSELVSCTVGGVSIPDTEINHPIELSSSIKNTGNVNLNPEIIITILNQKEIISKESFNIGDILSTTTKNSIKQIQTNLAIGQYWAEINIPVCGFTISKTFEIVEKGTIVDKGEFMKINLLNSSKIGDITPVQAFFKNTGERVVTAKFIGEVIVDGQIVYIIETDSIDISPGEIQTIDAYFAPTFAGQYQVKGRVVYNNKLSYEKEGQITVVSTDSINKTVKMNFEFIIIIFIVITIVLLSFIITKKKKKIKRKRIF